MSFVISSVKKDGDLSYRLVVKASSSAGNFIGGFIVERALAKCCGMNGISCFSPDLFTKPNRFEHLLIFLRTLDGALEARKDIQEDLRHVTVWTSKLYTFFINQGYDKYLKDNPKLKHIYTFQNHAHGGFFSQWLLDLSE